MKNTLVALLVASTLSGCAVWDAYFMAKFDVNEYQYIARIRTHAELGAPLCGTAAVRDEVKYIHTVAHEYKNYAQHIPRNDDSIKLSQTLGEITDEFYKRYQGDKDPSAAYCRAKMTAIAQSADNIQKVLGAKPR
jgi:hypothetical protein